MRKDFTVLDFRFFFLAAESSSKADFIGFTLNSCFFFFLKRTGESKRFDSAWQQCLTILEGLERNQWDRKRPELLECYRQTYRR